MKLIGTKVIEGQIIVKTGLHIGGDTKTMEIGGMDNPIIRNPATGEPYIPGSSLKGKMRALYEVETGRYGSDGRCSDDKCCGCGKPDCPVCTVFGSANNSSSQDNAALRGPTRLIVRDAFLSDEYSKKYLNGDILVEEKNENSINRITAVANPRPIERVLPGTVFDFEFVYRMYSENDEKLFSDVVIKAMKLLMNDYLGGGGSRGSGKIEFVNMKIDGEPYAFETSEH